MAMSEMPMNEKKHSYGGRQCMACGGKACNISYEQLRDMVEKKQNGDFMAKGGMVEETRHPKGGSSSRSKAAENWRHEGKQEGVHRSGDVHVPGESGMGRSVRAGDYSSAKKMHYQQRKEHNNMKASGSQDPDRLYAEGGEVRKPLGRMYAGGGEVKKPMPSPSPVADSGPLLDEDKVKKMQKGMASVFAEGGPVEKEMDDSEDMLMNQCAHECMEAVKKGDKTAFKDAMMAMVSEIMEKMGK